MSFPEEAEHWTDDADGDPVLPVPAADPEPRFVIRGKDSLAPVAIREYGLECEELGLHDQAAQVWLALAEIEEWQQRNPGLVKLPDHQHVPATGSGS